MILRRACAGEDKIAYRCIEDARAYHSSLGFVQWHPGYPTLQTIKYDIDAGVGFVFADSNDVCGYCCIIIGDEPAYHVIDGAWKTARPYAGVHRMAFSRQSRGTGLAGKALTLIKNFCVENGIEAIRVDTQAENKVMQHILVREGFEYCGLVTFDGGPKLAYEHIQDRCFYKIIRYRPYGVRERYQKQLGEEETDADYAERFAALARALGAEKTYVV